MKSSQLLLCWFSLALAGVADEQVFMGENHVNKNNITLRFDDLPTNESGIGYNPETNSTPLHYKDLYFQSFTVVDVAKARPNLLDPVDIMCAGSAPIALFSHRQMGHPWPRLSLHSLTDPSLPRDPNVTFSMRSLKISPTGNIPGKNGEAFVLAYLNLLKLPPDELMEQPRFPEMYRGAPIVPVGRRYLLIMAWGPGANPSRVFDYERFRKYVPGFGLSMDTFEIYGELWTRKGQNEPWHLNRDWELCVDDISMEIVKKTGKDEDEGETTNTEVGEEFRREFVFFDEDGDGIVDRERGERLARELRL